jgi:hypothetical protein
MWKLRQLWRIVKIRCRGIRPPSAEDRAKVKTLEPFGVDAARRARALAVEDERNREGNS